MKIIKAILKPSLCLSIILCSINILSSQQLFPVVQFTDTIHFHYGIQNNIPVLSDITLPPKGKFPDIKSIELSESDLLVNFSFDRNAKKYSPGVVTLKGIKEGNGRLIYPIESKLMEDDAKIPDEFGKRLWLDATEDVLDFHRDYDLIIVRSVMENIDCSKEKPVFAGKEQWPHYAVAGAGLMAIGIGQIYKSDSKARYKQYQDAWRNGLSEPLADKNYTDADKYKGQANTWTGVGIAIITVDAIVYAYRWVSIKNKQKQYDQFCTPQTDIGFSVIPLPGGTLGSTMDITARF